jgi:vitamin B12/bleomycin/antimicrobial peptide transport system ATP-binding/permease protein
MFLDEATASLDEETEEMLYNLVKSQLHKSTIVSAGHRSKLLAWHESRLRLTGGGKWIMSSDSRESAGSVGGKR